MGEGDGDERWVRGMGMSDVDYMMLLTFNLFSLLPSSPPSPSPSPLPPPPFPSSLQIASSRAFDEFGKISEQLEQETALRERAETMATEV